MVHKPTKFPNFSHDSLLDAGEEVALRLGISGLTLDAVAAEAGASKGGLLHHFPSKDALIEALVNRIVTNWRNDCIAAINAQPQQPGRVPRALLSMCLEHPEEWTDKLHRSSAVLIAAMANNPKLVEPLRAVYRELRTALRNDQLPPGVGEVILHALDGIWFQWIFGLHDVPKDNMTETRAVLHRILETAAASVSPGNTPLRSPLPESPQQP